MSGYHDGNDDGISHMVAKGLKPTRAIFFERIPLEESSVRCVRAVNEFLRHSEVILDVGDERRKFPRRR